MTEMAGIEKPVRTVRVVIDDDPELGPRWDDWNPDFPYDPGDVYDIPMGLHEVWRDIVDAYESMQGHLRTLLEERRGLGE